MQFQQIMVLGETNFLSNIENRTFQKLFSTGQLFFEGGENKKKNILFHSPIEKFLLFFISRDFDARSLQNDFLNLFLKSYYCIETLVVLVTDLGDKRAADILKQDQMN